MASEQRESLGMIGVLLSLGLLFAIAALTGSQPIAFLAAAATGAMCLLLTGVFALSGLREAVRWCRSGCAGGALPRAALLLHAAAVAATAALLAALALQFAVSLLS